MTHAQIMIYGAYGYTGELIAREAAARGLKPLLAGRDPEKLRRLSDDLGLDHIALEVSDTAALEANLRKCSVVVNCAGPFIETWEPMTRACLNTDTHYLDITGEFEVLQGCANLDARAQDAGITIMPGCGFDVVPTDCMAAMLVEKLPDANEITLAFKGLGQASRGTATTALPQLARPPLISRNGTLKDREGPMSVDIDFGSGPERVAALSWGDIVTAYHTTGVPSIEVFFKAPADMASLLRIPLFLRRMLVSPLGRPLLRAVLRRMPDGPDEATRTAGSCVVYGHARNAAGDNVELRLTTTDGYLLTSRTAVTIAEAAAAGTLPAGFQTPARALGSSFILSFPGCEMTA